MEFLSNSKHTLNTMGMDTLTDCLDQIDVIVSFCRNIVTAVACTMHNVHAQGT